MKHVANPPDQPAIPIDPIRAAFEKAFNEANGENYPPSPEDIESLEQTVRVGALKGKKPSVVLPPAISTLKKFGHTPTWVNVLKSLTDPMTPPDDGLFGLHDRGLSEAPDGTIEGSDDPEPLPSSPIDFGALRTPEEQKRKELTRYDAREVLKQEGFSVKQIRDALTPRIRKESDFPLGRTPANAAPDMIRDMEGGKALPRGWDLVEHRKAKDITAKKYTELEYQASISSEIESYKHYNAWMKTHIGQKAPPAIRRIRKNADFKAWANAGFPEDG